jgi:DMSO/TMAO reductase YedYZ molybdopterin-dependent catalytic subunit
MLFVQTLMIALLSSSSLFVFAKLNTAVQNPQQDSEWTLLVDGSVTNPLNLTYEQIRAMPKTTLYAEIHCVDYPGFALAMGDWTGVRMSLILKTANATSDAVKVAFRSDDGYSSDLTVATAMHEDIIIAYELNDQPLAEKLRLVVPGKWGYKWVSRLAHIELVNYDFKGTWESSGYSDEAAIPFFPTDLNMDGRVDLQDLGILKAAFWSRHEDQNWNGAADLDRNGLIDIVDIAMVAKNYERAAR